MTDLTKLPDSELNAICYVEVFGMTRLGDVNGRPCWRRPEGGKVVQDPPDYCNSPAAFWEVVEKVKPMLTCIGNRFDEKWRVEMDNDEPDGGVVDTIGRAITVAAILAARAGKEKAQ